VASPESHKNLKTPNVEDLSMLEMKELCILLLMGAVLLTRSIRCNYCMGHCEMLLEVAGLDKGAVAERTRRLAGDDWSCFPPAEQRAYAYARKLTKTPWELTPADYKGLEQDLGLEQAMATFWWLCRGLYMTRVSDGFQLPLERDNVFADFFGKGSARGEASPSLAK
jgi:hypothetical protein